MSKSIIDFITTITKPSPCLDLTVFVGKPFYNLPTNNEGKLDLDMCNCNYSYSIAVTSDKSLVSWNDEISSIRIIVNEKTFIIEDIYYYEYVTAQRLDKVIFPETGHFSFEKF
jgi:hypothetical protein